ncbi:hypothetical protein E5347_11730 [Clostridium sartagoforme]|uniref:DUF1648 domain-containing protein n=1 Tax=Clostridium sartagoforme TaxID=84031 RepID=A0A4S2DIL7_9CLOT|nr:MULTISPECIES: hypothetical protein [Clostridium]MBS5939078.1 hypothetical protein [Clostridium sp.]TGY41675.1 hypothetical protein E5347_11730 [Clostridium sartagoforme]
MKNKRTKLQRVIDFISMVIAVAIITSTILSYSELPETVPIYLRLDGSFESFVANKYAIFVYIGIGSVMFLITSVLSMYPRIIVEKLKMTKVEITNENRDRQYSLAKTFIKILGLEFIILFGYMQYSVTQATINNVNTIGASYLVGLAIIIFSIIGYSIKSTKMK